MGGALYEQELNEHISQTRELQQTPGMFLMSGMTSQHNINLKKKSNLHHGNKTSPALLNLLESATCFHLGLNQGLAFNDKLYSAAQRTLLSFPLIYQQVRTTGHLCGSLFQTFFLLFLTLKVAQQNNSSGLPYA